MFDTRTSYLERLGTKIETYRLEKVLRHDQVRTVYEAFDEHEKLVQICLFEFSLSLSHERREQIQSYIESLRAAALQGVEELSDCGFTRFGEPYLVSRPPTVDCLADLLKSRQIFQLHEALAFGTSAAEVLARLYAAQFSHGCMSPTNLFWDGHQATVGDVASSFVASKISEGASSMISGIPLYMSPERLAGEAPTEASDVYALAAILYELIAGVPPHPGQSAFEIAVKRTANVPKLRSVNSARYGSAVEALFLKSLSPRSDVRFQSMTEFADAMAKLHSGGVAEPKIAPHNLPRKYNIMRLATGAGVAEMQTIDSGLLRDSLTIEAKRNKRVGLLFVLFAAIGVGLYGAILFCLTGMHQESKQFTQSLAVQTPTRSRNFAIDPPKLDRGELTGDTKLSSVMKFSSGYGLQADGCVGNFKAVATLKDLEFLSIRGTNITDDDLVSLVRLPLRMLNISQCRNVHGSGFSEIQKIASLRMLEAQDVSIQDQDLKVLNRNLIELDLRGCNLSDQAVKSIALLRNLNQLLLANNHITRRSFADLQQLKHLYLLDLQGNKDLTREDIVELMKLMPHTVIRYQFAPSRNSSLFQNVPIQTAIDKSNGIELNAQGTGGDFSQLHKLTGLTSIDLSRSSIADDGVALLSKLPLRYICLSSCKVDGGALRATKEIEPLVVFKASTTEIQDLDLINLNPNLRMLDLSSCRLTDEGVKQIAGLKNLVSLSLHNNAISPKSLALLRTLKQLKYLDITDCGKISTERAREFEHSLSDTVVLLNWVRR